MEGIDSRIKSVHNYIFTFIKWIILSSIVGLLSGLVGTLFHVSVEYATEFRIKHDFIILLLPVGGLIIVFLYKLAKVSENIGTNNIINSIRSDEKIPTVLAPLIFISTVITHLLGGSAGREGAALQLGGSIGSFVGTIFHLDEKDMHLIILCGMSGVFSALFGTPLTATFFAMEVISIGIIYYSSLVPCLMSSLAAYQVSLYFGVEPVRFFLDYIPQVMISSIFKVIILSVLIAVLSIIFCITMTKVHKVFEHKIKNEYKRAAVGGFIIIVLTLLLNTRDYNGAGMDIISQAINGNAKPEAFILKIIFTAITIGAGFKGGEIVPTFFIGSTFGCLAGSVLGLDPGLSAAICFVALFCSVVNCPIASIILSIEVFGGEGLLLFAVACGVSYVLSGYYGLYSSQKIMYSKLKAEYINIFAK